MKKILFCLSLCLLTIACNLEPEGVGNGEIEVSNTDIFFKSKSYYENLTVTTSGAWKVAVSSDWVSVSQKAGKGDADVSIVVTENTANYARTAHVQFYTKSSSKTVTVVQFAVGDDDGRSVPVDSATLGDVTIENGAIKAAFSVSSTKKVYFSQGNLQYQASTGIWRFAENQWNVVGDAEHGTVYENGVKCDNALISPTYSGWIDLFGYGTSGWNSGANEYQPYAANASGYAYLENNLTGEYAKADWGVYNKIQNGGNKENMWRTPSLEEWEYLITYRENADDLYAQAMVNGQRGLVILPDGCKLHPSLRFLSHEEVIQWLDDNNVHPYLFYDLQWTVNTYSLNEWMAMESYGAVFLPITGGRIEHWVRMIYASWDKYDMDGNFGYYWSSTHIEDRLAGGFNVNTVNVAYTSEYVGKENGQAVRLIQDVQ